MSYINKLYRKIITCNISEFIISWFYIFSYYARLSIVVLLFLYRIINFTITFFIFPQLQDSGSQKTFHITFLTSFDDKSFLKTFFLIEIRLYKIRKNNWHSLHPISVPIQFTSVCLGLFDRLKKCNVLNEKMGVFDV